MTATLEQAADVEKVRQAERPAELFFLKHLASIAGGVDDIRPGDQNFDFCVPVPASRLHEIGMQIAELEFDVQERFGVRISAIPIPIPG